MQNGTKWSKSKMHQMGKKSSAALHWRVLCYGRSMWKLQHLFNADLLQNTYGGVRVPKRMLSAYKRGSPTAARRREGHARGQPPLKQWSKGGRPHGSEDWEPYSNQAPGDLNAAQVLVTTVTDLTVFSSSAWVHRAKTTCTTDTDPCRQ